MVFYQQEEVKPDYMKILLQGLAALLLISLIMLAWSVRSWFLSRAERNLAEIQMAPATALTTTVKAEVEQKPSVAVAPAVAPAVAVAPAPKAEAQGDGGLSSSVDQALDNLKQQSAARAKQATAAAPAISPPDVNSAQPATKEDKDYVQALTVQYQDRGKATEQLSDEELAKRIDAGAKTQTTQGKVEDVTNKVLISAGNGQPARGNNLQSDLDTLVAASLQTLNEGKAAPATPPAYLQGLQQEAEIRENEARTVIVKSGDTLTALSARAYGSSTQYMKIFRANPTLITDPNRIFIGQVLRVPL
ncbi:MAG: hypothetical protein A2286_06975 [Gammaproteobacteria bacterium RIFOXYA12_FULL_61_12]|nr:MAG: hypothetical protein A2514_08030 [Gammaproteobacteria bacterium RIFOXYD12_FULL_61_37]OGT92357.1 MAG: hypothetical protein A2286_06975 [Gammaproteobacteria bacterium RIFOXYA12_FULL_61_12]